MNIDIDFLVMDHGSIIVLTPNSDEAKQWVKEHIPPEAQWFARGVVIEHRYADDIIDAILGTDMTINNYNSNSHLSDHLSVVHVGDDK